MNNRLRSEFFRTFKSTAGGTEVVGTFHKVGDTYGIAFAQKFTTGETITAAEDVITIYNADKIMVGKVEETGDSIAIGVKVYLNVTSWLVSDTKGQGDICVGICTRAAAAADSLVEIDLKGDSMTDQA